MNYVGDEGKVAKILEVLFCKGIPYVRSGCHVSKKGGHFLCTYLGQVDGRRTRHPQNMTTHRQTDSLSGRAMSRLDMPWSQLHDCLA